MDRYFVFQKEYVYDKYDPDGMNLHHLISQYSGQKLDRSIVVNGADISKACKEISNLSTSNGIHWKIIPVGNLDFVRDAMRVLTNDPEFHLIPIEIPNIIQHHALRSYFILTGDELLHKMPESFDITNSKRWYIKDASTPKSWNNLLLETDCSRFIKPDTRYVVSQRVTFSSEWRVFVCRGRIVGIMNYMGDVTQFPDIIRIRDIMADYHTFIDHPDSYTIDVGEILYDSGLHQTALIEIHPFAACGLYGFYDPIIMDMLEDGVKWYLAQQKKG